MEQLVLIVFVVVCAAMVGLVLLQQGKGADMGASFGSGGSQTVFGPAGSGNVLTRTTAILATLFFLGSFALAYMAKNNARLAQEDGIPVPALVESEAATQAIQGKIDKAVEEIPVAADSALENDEIPAAPDEQ